MNDNEEISIFADMKKNLQIRNSTMEFLTFVLDGKEDGVQVLYKDDTIWATQKALLILFDCSTDNITILACTLKTSSTRMN